MPMLVRATTTSNAQGRRQHLHLPSTSKSNELDVDYFHALKIINQTPREPQATPLISKHRSDTLRQRKSRSFYQFSNTLSPIGQEAMMKTYEDTLINHLSNVYTSKRVSAVLPRLPTAIFRHRLPTIKNNSNHGENIRQAQNLIDDIINQNAPKEDLLYDYVRWQHNWTRNS